MKWERHILSFPCLWISNHSVNIDVWAIDSFSESVSLRNSPGGIEERVRLSLFVCVLSIVAAANNFLPTTHLKKDRDIEQGEKRKSFPSRKINDKYLKCARDLESGDHWSFLFTFWECYMSAHDMYWLTCACYISFPMHSPAFLSFRSFFFFFFVEAKEEEGLLKSATNS